MFVSSEEQVLLERHTGVSTSSGPFSSTYVEKFIFEVEVRYEDGLAQSAVMLSIYLPIGETQSSPWKSV